VGAKLDLGRESEGGVFSPLAGDATNRPDSGPAKTKVSPNFTNTPVQNKKRTVIATSRLNDSGRRKRATSNTFAALQREREEEIFMWILGDSDKASTAPLLLGTRLRISDGGPARGERGEAGEFFIFGSPLRQRPW